MEHTAQNPMFMALHWPFVLMMLAEAAVMAPWVRAYKRFPRGMNIVLDGLIPKEQKLNHPMAKHPVQTRLFVLWCAYSHLVMASRALAHIALMFIPSALAYHVSMGWLLLTLIPLIWGGVYSEKVTTQFWEDAGRINLLLRRLVRQVERQEAHDMRHPGNPDIPR